ncbi:MFS transporter [Aspergillus neoniger CBS 115656]|uniref:MFS general substrate transporter n=1 Tax=Aspergillus neoniger (strain CBS 115656) TaxID=1448310 RepID=A0A318YLQ4_ASPNB|nr:MFS general substrate transporter [Aspergillus neoniger CBS 115656]PYH34707.1 MFS general substrate transporter [Aspergillus neoniger CBS 115656]
MSTTTIELVSQGQEESQNPVQLFGPSTEEAIVQQKQKWNDPPINRWRLLATFISFTVVGANDGVYGALVPYLREDYSLSTTVVSLIFVTPFAGYTIATLIVNKIHMTLGQRGIAMIGPLCHIIPYVIMAIHPPWPAMLAVYVIVGLGNGLIDAAWNSWIADMANANAMMGVLQAFYGLGATISPLVGTQMIKSGLRWNYFYYTLLGASVLDLMVSSTLFWGENAASYRAKNHRGTDSGGGSRTTEAMKSPITWLMAVWLFVYMGVEVSVGGWVVDFMVQVRHGEPYESGLIPTGFWAGVTVGRLVLGFVNDRLGERIAISIYLAISIALELIFWLVPQFIVSAVAVSLLGFFTGPLFPAAIVVAAKLLPKHLHTPGIGLASALAGGGGAILPFVAGAISGARGVQSLQPFVLALLIALITIWVLLPRRKHHAYGV